MPKLDLKLPSAATKLGTPLFPRAEGCAERGAKIVKRAFARIVVGECGG